MINDAHCHFFSSRFLELLAPDTGGADEIAVRLQWEAAGTPTELADRWIVELDRHGVARAALIASIPGDAVSVAEAGGRPPPPGRGLFLPKCETRRSPAVLPPALHEEHMRAG